MPNLRRLRVTCTPPPAPVPLPSQNCVTDMADSTTQAVRHGARALAVSVVLMYAGCHPFVTEPIANQITFSPRLSEYGLFRDAMSDLTPHDDVRAFSLNTPLFSDYALKQRLLRLPAGMFLTGTGSGLPSFPDGTMLVKTFYFDRDVRRPSLGRQIIETRLLIKHEGRWNASTYLWNDAQDEATLLSNGVTVPIEWVDSTGARRSVAYEVPSTADCSVCHGSAGALMPIGPKLRNLRVPSQRALDADQLERLVQDGLVQHTGLASVVRLPRWDDAAYSLDDRARAYLDVNCAHCHAASGLARATGLLLEFERPIGDTRINSRRDRIMSRLTSTRRTERMPRLGTTLGHDEGIALIREYLAQR